MTDIEIFIEWYLKKHHMSRYFFDNYFVVRPCNCKKDDCKGFAVVENTPYKIKIHKDLYEN